MCHTTVYIERYRRVQDGGNETKEPRRFMFTCFKLQSTRTFVYIHRSSLVWMRSNLVVRVSDCQCRSRNSPGFDPSILRHSGIRGAADEAVLNTVLGKKEIQKNPPVSYSPTQQYPPLPSSFYQLTHSQSHTLIIVGVCLDGQRTSFFYLSYCGIFFGWRSRRSIEEIDISMGQRGV